MSFADFDLTRKHSCALPISTGGSFESWFVIAKRHRIVENMEDIIAEGMVLVPWVQIALHSSPVTGH